MSSTVHAIPAGQAYAAVSLAMPAGTVIVNQSSTEAVWLSDGPNVAAGNGIPVQPLGSVTWAQDGPCYAVCDTSATSPVQLLVTDAVSQVTDPVALAVAVAAKLLAQQQPVAVQNTPTVELAAGTAVELAAGTTVDLANGTAVTLEAGTQVALAGPVALATGTQVAVSGGTLTGITNAIPVQSHAVTSVGSITNAIPVQTHAVSSVGSITNTVTVQGTAKVQQMSQVQQLATMQFTCPTTGVIPSGTYDLKVSGLNQYASVLITIDTLTAISNIPAPLYNKGLQGQFLWSPGVASGGSEQIAYWHLARLIRLTDFIQIPCLNDQLELTFTPTAAPSSAVEYLVTILGSNLYIPRIRYSQGGGSGNDPTQFYVSTYSTAATYFDYPGTTSGRFFFNLRSNSSAGSSRLYPLAVPAGQAIESVSYPTGTAAGTSFSGEFPSSLAPIALQTSVVTAGANAITCSSEIV